MRILVIAPHPFFQERGTPIAVRALIEVLAAEGHHVDLVTYHEGQDIPLTAGTHHRILSIPLVKNVRPGPSIKKLICDKFMFLKCLSLARRGHYDLVHAVEEAAFIAIVLKKLFGIPFLYDMDSSIPLQIAEKYPWLSPVTGMLRWAEGLAVRQSSGVVAVCKAIEDSVREHDATKPLLRLEDFSLIDPQAARREAAAAPLEAPRPIALYVGNLEYYQGIDLLLDGFARVAGDLPQGSVVIIGGNDTDIARYRERARELGIADRVSFLGPRPLPALGSYLVQADVLVSPRMRGYNTPMKIYSYLHSGRPLLATRLPTHTQVLDDDIACLVEPTAAAMGEGLGRLFQDADFAARLGAAAGRRAEQEFTREAYSAKLKSFYGTVGRDLAPQETTAPPA